MLLDISCTEIASWEYVFTSAVNCGVKWIAWENSCHLSGYCKPGSLKGSAYTKPHSIKSAMNITLTESNCSKCHRPCSLNYVQCTIGSPFKISEMALVQEDVEIPYIFISIKLSYNIVKLLKKSNRH